MSDADWGGAHADQNDARYYQQQPQAYAGQQQVYASPYAPQGYEPPHVQDHAPEGQWAQPPQSGGGGIVRALHGSGALLSLALIAGLGVWGYQLAMRDVTGVPVVRALEGPMRIQPEDPGGVAAAHQGFAVNAIAAEGQAEGPASEVALAPAPAALEDEDLPAHPDDAISAVSMAEADETVPDEPAAVAPQAAALTEETETDDMAAVLAMADALASGAAPLTGDEADLALTDEAETRLASAAVTEILPITVPGVVHSPRPKLRPEEVVARAAASPIDLAVASAAAATASAVREISATEISAGTRLVQLGAFDSEEVARTEWTRISARFPEMLDGKGRVIEKAQSGGKTFYRLRAEGFEDLSDARRFCAALMAGQAACIPVVTR